MNKPETSELKTPTSSYYVSNTIDMKKLKILQKKTIFWTSATTPDFGDIGILTEDLLLRPENWFFWKIFWRICPNGDDYVELPVNPPGFLTFNVDS